MITFSVLSTAVCEPVYMATYPNVVMVDTKSKILLSMLHLILSCFRLPSSAKDSTNFSCFSTSTSIDLLPRKVCKSVACSFRVNIVPFISLMVSNLLESSVNYFSICNVTFSSTSFNSPIILCSMVSR